MLEQNQNLEDQLEETKKERDRLKLDKTNLTQKVNVLNDDVEKLKQKLDECEEGGQGEINELKKEVEQLTVTNGVYMNKINELVDTMNKMEQGKS